MSSESPSRGRKRSRSVSRERSGSRSASRSRSRSRGQSRARSRHGHSHGHGHADAASASASASVGSRSGRSHSRSGSRLVTRVRSHRSHLHSRRSHSRSRPSHSHSRRSHSRGSHSRGSHSRGSHSRSRPRSRSRSLVFTLPSSSGSHSRRTAPRSALSSAVVPRVEPSRKYKSDFVAFNGSFRAHGAWASRHGSYAASYCEGSSSSDSSRDEQAVRGEDRDVRDAYLSWAQRSGASSAGGPYSELGSRVDGDSDGDGDGERRSRTARGDRLEAVERREAVRVARAVAANEIVVAPKMHRVFDATRPADERRPVPPPRSGQLARYGLRRYRALFDEAGLALGAPESMVYATAVRAPVARRRLRRVPDKNWVLEWLDKDDARSDATPWPRLYLRLHGVPVCPTCAFWAAYAVKRDGTLERGGAAVARAPKSGRNAWMCARCGSRYGSAKSKKLVVVAPPGVRVNVRARTPASNRSSLSAITGRYSMSGDA